MKITSSYQEILNKDDIKNDLIKPLHQYAQKISPKPLVKDGFIIQEVYSESVIKMLGNNKILMVSRPAIQQYRIIENFKYTVPKNCFDTLFEFYISWFPDIDKNVKILSPKKEESPFLIPEEIIINFKNLYQEPRIDLNPVWVPFFVKNDYLQFKKGYAKIELGSIAYQIEM